MSNWQVDKKGGHNQREKIEFFFMTVEDINFWYVSLIAFIITSFVILRNLKKKKEKNPKVNLP